MQPPHSRSAHRAPGRPVRQPYSVATHPVPHGRGAGSNEGVNGMDLSDQTVGQIPRLTGRDVRIATWICFFAWTFAVYDFVLFGNLLPELAADLGWSSARSTGINTLGTARNALRAL